VVWLWLGGGLIVVGSVLAAVPGKRRRPTDPVSAPVAGTRGSSACQRRGEDAGAAGGDGVGSHPEPVGAGEPS
jgi:hypothetical protein